MAKATALPGWQQALIVLTSTVVGVVVLAFLYFAQKIFIPVALAIFLTFLLSPLVTALQKRGLGRVPSVVVVALLTALVLGGLTWVVTREVVNLVQGLPNYSENIKAKTRSLRDMVHGAGSGRLAQLIEDVSNELSRQPGTPAVIPSPDQPTVVVRQLDSSSWLSRLLAALSSVSEMLATFALTAVLVLFMLLKREDLRDRLIRLVGGGRLTVTTRAVDEAGQRISRFLLVQAIINGCYGTVVAVGLTLLGVEHALLWGLLAALLRYVPYVGIWIAVLPPILLSLAQFPGWWRPSLVVALYAVIELVTVNVLEPRLFGQSMGVSEVALLVAAAFWAILWGPVGLVLSSPLTVVLAVLGKYVPHLAFLDVLLGDEPPLDPEVSYYQRLLARDQDEAVDLALAQVQANPPEQVYDALLIPALNFTLRDRQRDDLTEADEQFIVRATQEVIEDLGERKAASTPAEEESSPKAQTPKVRLLGCPSHAEADHLALEMLQQLLDPKKWDMEIAGVETLPVDLLAKAEATNPAVICIGSMPPGGLAHTRYLCKRLRARLPDVKLIVGCWGLKGNVESNMEQLREAGADDIETTLLDTRNHLNAWLPALAEEAARAVANGDEKDRQQLSLLRRSWAANTEPPVASLK